MRAVAVAVSSSTHYIHSSTAGNGPCAARCGRAQARCSARQLHSAAPARVSRRALLTRAAPELVEWDVVVYKSDSGTTMGRISELQPQAAVIERLEEEEAGLWAVTDEVDSVPLREVQCVLDADYLQLCDADRVSNPHGEHAYEAFRILSAVPPGLWGSKKE